MNFRRELVALAVVLRVGAANAEETRAFRVSYSAPSDCPAKEAFSAEIESNSTLAHPASPGEAAIDVDARAAPQRGGFLGTLSLRRPDGTETTRDVPAASCSEAASAMALIAAIAIDPDAASGRALAVSSAGMAPLFEPAVGEPPPPPDAAPTRADTPPVRSRESRTHGKRPWSFGTSVGVGVAQAMAPVLSPEVALGVGFGSTQKTLLSPLLLLSGRLAESPTVSNEEGTAQFQRLTGRISGCPVAIQIAPVQLRPCGFFELGQLGATGSHVVDQASANILWVALGATLRGDVELAGPFTLAVELGGLFPLVRDTFYFKPSGVSIYEIPAAGFIGVVELGVRIL